MVLVCSYALAGSGTYKGELRFTQFVRSVSLVFGVRKVNHLEDIYMRDIVGPRNSAQALCGLGNLPTLSNPSSAILFLYIGYRIQPRFTAFISTSSVRATTSHAVIPT